MTVNVVIGDTVIDEVEDGSGMVRRLCGGSALNVATALRRLGQGVELVTAFGADGDGDLIRAFLHAEDITAHVAPEHEPTRVVRSRQVAGEPVYAFTDTTLRRIHFGAPQSHLVGRAASVVVSAPSIIDPEQAALLTGEVDRCPGLRAVDPNPRVDLIGDLPRFRRHFEQVAAVCALVKMSVGDVRTLYDDDEDVVARRMLRLGVRAVVLTRGSAGATAYTRVGTVTHPGIRIQAIDTVGAGDATLAGLVRALLRDGWPATRAEWTAVLEFGMAAAALTCAAPGGATATPTIAQVERLLDEHGVVTPPAEEVS